MPRNGSNVFSLPAGSTAVDGAAIMASTHNTPLNDLVTELNDNLMPQLTAVDAVVNRVLRVGAFGLGGTAPTIGNAAVTDNSIATGFYRYTTSGGSSGGPTGATAGTLIHIRRTDAGGETQLFITGEGTSPTIASATLVRSRETGAWTAWLPPGVYDYGSNANGRYLRYLDGTAICTHALSTSSAAEATWTLPVAFTASNAYRVSAVPSAAGLASYAPRITNKAATALDLSVFNTSNARVALSLEITAIGQWA